MKNRIRIGLSRHASTISVVILWLATNAQFSDAVDLTMRRQPR